MRNQPPGQPITPPKLTYVDRPEIAEIFADGVARMSFDGSTLRIEFGVNRFDEGQAPAQQTGRTLTACRLVLPGTGMLDLFGRLSTLIDALRSRGLLKMTPTEPTQPAE